MKEVFKNLLLFCALCVAFSSLTACTGTQTTQAPSNGPETNAPANAATDSKSSQYPPLVSGVAQADIELVDGTTTKVSERKGKVLLLNLWGIWCAPCREEMPHLIKLQDEYKDRGFEVIGLNVGDEDMQPESNEKIKEFAEKEGLNYTLAHLSDSLAVEFNKVTKFGGVPQSLLVDRDGHLRGIFLGGGPKTIQSMQETVDKVMSE